MGNHVWRLLSGIWDYGKSSIVRPKGIFLYTILYNYTKMRYANLYNLKILRIFAPER
jgi:hypothetical protein